jgi:AraC-like DNA-binding protein
MSADLRSKIPIGMAEALREAGVSYAEVLATAGLSPRLLDIAGPLVSIRDYFALWQAIRTVSGNPSIGIILTTLIRPELTEPLFLAVLSARSVRAAIETVARYKRIFEPQGLDVREDETNGLVILTLPDPECDMVQPQVLVDTQFAFLIEMCRRGTHMSKLSPREVRLRVGALDTEAGHAEYFNCPIRLGAPANALVFAAEDVERPFLTHNPQLESALLPYLNASTPASPHSSIARVRAVIAERIRGQRLTVHAVGRELAMSSRAMQRVLRDNGTSFRQLLEDVRREHAQSYLSTTSFSDDEVAFLLGFEEANSFYRAFRSWHGVSPAEFRRRTARPA